VFSEDNRAELASVWPSVPPAIHCSPMYRVSTGEDRAQEDNVGRRAGQMQKTLPAGYASLSSSVRYLGARVFTFWMKAACSVSLSFGGGAVRVATGTPISLK